MSLNVNPEELSRGEVRDKQEVGPLGGQQSPGLVARSSRCHGRSLNSLRICGIRLCHHQDGLKPVKLRCGLHVDVFINIPRRRVGYRADGKAFGINLIEAGGQDQFPQSYVTVIHHIVKMRQVLPSPFQDALNPAFLQHTADTAGGVRYQEDLGGVGKYGNDFAHDSHGSDHGEISAQPEIQPFSDVNGVRSFAGAGCDYFRGDGLNRNLVLEIE